MTAPTDIHSCSYFCTRPACVLAQRDELRDSHGAGNQVPPTAQPARCTICNGDDMQAPCAYPGEGIFGCVRDKRLKAAQPAPPIAAAQKARP